MPINHSARWIFLAVVLGLMAVVNLTPTQAQIPTDPIIITLNGDLWSWEGPDQPLTQLTDWGYNDQPILSPDGTRVAYTSFATVFVDWLATISGTGGYSPPNNIWILDIPSQQTYRVADQPANASWTGPNDAGNYSVRTYPSWSPDGQRLAWLELISDESLFADGVQMSTGHVVVYNLVSRTTAVLDTFSVEYPIAIIGRFRVSWGRPGILINAPDLDGVLPWGSRTYDLSGNLIAETDSGDLLIGEWLQDGEQDYIFSVNVPDRLGNWRTGQEETLNGNVEMYSLGAPDGATLFHSGDNWHVAFPGQDSIDLGDDIRPYGVSRDGQAVIYGRWEIDPTREVFAYTVLLYTPDQMIEIGRYNNVFPVWGPTGWRVRSE